MTHDDASEFVRAWYFTFVWGFLVNILRIYMISQFAPIKGQEILTKYQNLPKTAEEELKKKILQEQKEKYIKAQEKLKDSNRALRQSVNNQDEDNDFEVNGATQRAEEQKVKEQLTEKELIEELGKAKRRKELKREIANLIPTLYGHKQKINCTFWETWLFLPEEAIEISA